MVSRRQHERKVEIVAIITRTKVKTLLQISGTSKDAVIDALIPVVQNLVVEELSNRFHMIDAAGDPAIYITASTIAFVDSDPDTITDSDSGFVDAAFSDGIDVDVSGSDYNDGIYGVNSVAAGTLTLEAAEELTAEDAGAGVTITRVQFPKGIWSTVADMILWKMDKKRLLNSWGLADYRESMSGTGGIPKQLWRELNPWRKYKWP